MPLALLGALSPLMLSFSLRALDSDTLTLDAEASELQIEVRSLSLGELLGV